MAVILLYSLFCKVRVYKLWKESGARDLLENEMYLHYTNQFNEWYESYFPSYTLPPNRFDAMLLLFYAVNKVFQQVPFE